MGLKRRATTLPVAETTTQTRKIDIALAVRLRLKDGLTYEQIAERFGCTRQSVSAALERFTCLTENPAQLEAYRANKLGLFETVEQALLERLLKEATIGRASVGDLARAMDTIAKHVRLLSGQSTQNIGLLVQTLGDVHKDLDAALASPSDPAVADAQVIDKVEESGGPTPGTELAGVV